MSNSCLTTCLKHFEKLQGNFQKKKIGDLIKIGVRTPLSNDRKEILEGIVVKIVDGSKITVRKQSSGVEYLFSGQNKNIEYHK